MRATERRPVKGQRAYGRERQQWKKQHNWHHAAVSRKRRKARETGREKAPAWMKWLCELGTQIESRGEKQQRKPHRTRMGADDREAARDGTKTRTGHGKQKGREKTRSRNACELSISREVKRMRGKGKVDMLTGYNTTKDLRNRTKDAMHTQRAQRGHTGSWYAFDSTLGFPGEGHEKGAGPNIKERGAWVTVNVAGVHVVTNDKASRIDIKEASDKLVHNYSDKLWELVNVYTSLKTEVMILADTHTLAEEAEIIKDMLKEQGIEVNYTPAIINETGHATAGVMVWTNPTVIEVKEVREITAGRTIRITAEEALSGEEWSIYGTYMPVRGTPHTVDEVNESWKALKQAMEAEHIARVAIGGDLNAETQAETGARRKKNSVRQTSR